MRPSGRLHVSGSSGDDAILYMDESTSYVFLVVQTFRSMALSLLVRIRLNFVGS